MTGRKTFKAIVAAHGPQVGLGPDLIFRIYQLDRQQNMHPEHRAPMRSPAQPPNPPAQPPNPPGPPPQGNGNNSNNDDDNGGGGGGCVARIKSKDSSAGGQDTKVCLGTFDIDLPRR